MRYEINPVGILIAIFVGAVVLLAGGSWPLAVVVGLAFVPALILACDIAIWLVDKIDAYRRRRRLRRTRGAR